MRRHQTIRDIDIIVGADLVSALPKKEAACLVRKGRHKVCPYECIDIADRLMSAQSVLSASIQSRRRRSATDDVEGRRAAKISCALSWFGSFYSKRRWPNNAAACGLIGSIAPCKNTKRNACNGFARSCVLHITSQPASPRGGVGCGRPAHGGRWMAAAVPR